VQKYGDPELVKAHYILKVPLINNNLEATKQKAIAILKLNTNNTKIDYVMIDGQKYKLIKEKLDIPPSSQTYPPKPGPIKTMTTRQSPVHDQRPNSSPKAKPS